MRVNHVNVSESTPPGRSSRDRLAAPAVGRQTGSAAAFQVIRRRLTRTSPTRRMPVYDTSFEIDASPEQVWETLTSFDRYPEWNPQIPVIHGRLEVGETIRLRLTLPGRPALVVSAKVEQLDPNVLLTWRGHVLAPWFFEGYRRFEIRPLGESGVMFTHVEDIHGILGPVFSLLMGSPQQRSHEALNQALRARAEAR